MQTTMQTTSRTLGGALLCALLLLCGASESEEELSPRALRDFYPQGPNLTSEKQLCDVGEQCAVRKGARIGKMCDCPRGAFCNFFLLKCL
ncbi:cocaine- and amphetamine-regulated transcript protein-like isoform X3 [Cyclopterus lumpus]|uniref:cocaine- and amphetamine-regulated transcript protein-like isoform X3 n=1 Tax=Cyclopterus lumpus TaxID=8103 RepID=UPI001486AB53|nr:cocaine- and amphetamine-regulated transcript protein-like isoform X3 [Cyclopterus lumpus]